MRGDERRAALVVVIVAVTVTGTLFAVPASYLAGAQDDGNPLALIDDLGCKTSPNPTQWARNAPDAPKSPTGIDTFSNNWVSASAVERSTFDGIIDSYLNSRGLEALNDPSGEYPTEVRTEDWTLELNRKAVGTARHILSGESGETFKAKQLTSNPDRDTRVNVEFFIQEGLYNVDQWLKITVEKRRVGSNTYRQFETKYIGSCEFNGANNGFAWHTNAEGEIDKILWETADGYSGDFIQTMYLVETNTLRIWRFEDDELVGYRELQGNRERGADRAVPDSYTELQNRIDTTSHSGVSIRSGQAIDPNEIVGRPNATYLQPGAKREFYVRFENLENATGPARTVRVTAPLDEDLNASTLEMGATSHPDSLSTKTLHDGTLRWVFRGIDLPPNLNPPDGQGWAKFTVRTKENLETGTKIHTQASIVFNNNPPLSTNNATFVVDGTAPTSDLDATALQTGGANTTYELSVETDDEGAGVSRTLVYISRNGSEYRRHRTLPANQSVFTFDAAVGTNYSFASVAVDAVGNRENLTGSEASVPASRDVAGQATPDATRTSPVSPGTTVGDGGGLDFPVLPIIAVVILLLFAVGYRRITR